MTNRIIFTPVTPGSDTLNNFKHEMAESNLFRPMMWDGEVNGKDEIGDFFGFVNHTHKDTNEIPARTIRVTRVTGILGSSASRRHWTGDHSLTANGNSKNVLVLDPFWKDIPYDLWIINARKKDGTPYENSTALHNATKRFHWPF